MYISALSWAIAPLVTQVLSALGGGVEHNLVGSQSRVSLDSVASVDMKNTLVIKPRYSEQNLPLRLGNALQHVCIFWLLLDYRSQGCEDLLDCLKELLLVGVTSYNPVIGFLHKLNDNGASLSSLRKAASLAS